MVGKIPGPVPLTKTLTSLSAAVFPNERRIITTSRLTDTAKIKCNVVGGHSLIRWRSYYTVTILYALLSYLLLVCFVCFCLFCYHRPVKQRLTTTALLGTGRCNSAFKKEKKKKRHGTEREEELTLCGGGRQNPSPGQHPQKLRSTQWMLYLTGAVVFVPSVHEGRYRWEWAHWALFIYYTLCRGVYSFFSVWRHRSSSYWPINLAFWPPAKTSSLSSKLAVVRKERCVLSAPFCWARPTPLLKEHWSNAR